MILFIEIDDALKWHILNIFLLSTFVKSKNMNLSQINFFIFYLSSDDLINLKSSIKRKFF